MLQVYSTLTRKKEPFPKRPGEAVSMYVCGPTVYKPSHIGHMSGRSFSTPSNATSRTSATT